MKKNLWFLGILLMGASFIVSCSDNDKDDSKKEQETIIEESKAKVEAAGLSILNDAEMLADEPGVTISQRFMDLTANLQVGGAAGSSLSIAPIRAIANLDAVNGVVNLGSEIKMEGTTEEEDISMKELFDNPGTYTYNMETNTWDFVAGQEGVSFIFPATASDETNNTIINLSEMEFKLIEEEYVPTLLKLNMKTDGVEVLSISYSVDLTSGEDAPQALNVKVIISDFEFYIDEKITNNTDLSSLMNFKKGDNVLVSLEMSGKGDFSGVEGDQDLPQFLHTADFTLQLGDVEVKGDGNMKAIYDGEKTLDDEYDGQDYDYASELEREKKMVDLVNSNVNLTMGFTNGETLADMEFVVMEDQDEYGLYFYVDVQMVFADDSKVDSESYFGEMLDKFLEKWTGITTTSNL